jgi:hypothetical protein
VNVEKIGDVLKQSRSRIHAFDKSEFESVEALAVKTLELGSLLVEKAESEYRFRRNGLLVAVATMILLAVLMTLKIREIDSNE